MLTQAISEGYQIVMSSGIAFWEVLWLVHGGWKAGPLIRTCSMTMWLRMSYGEPSTEAYELAGEVVLGKVMIMPCSLRKSLRVTSASGDDDDDDQANGQDHRKLLVHELLTHGATRPDGGVLVHKWRSTMTENTVNG